MYLLREKSDLNTWFSPDSTGKFYKLETHGSNHWFWFRRLQTKTKTSSKPEPSFGLVSGNHGFGLLVSWFETKPSTSLHSKRFSEDSSQPEPES
jgi:hypothetical protein